MTDERASEVLVSSSAVLLDFDGPVCSVFAGLPAPQVAEHLRSVLRRAGAPITSAIFAETDPLEVLRFSADLGMPGLALQVDEALCEAEMAAVSTAQPTVGSAEFMRAMRQDRRPLIIVSNNSAPAVHAYLAMQDLAAFVVAVVGRSLGRPELMKPNPAPVLEALRLLNAKASDTVLIGDSLADVEAARACGVASIGLATGAHKCALLREAGAEVVIESMLELAAPAP